MILYYKLVKIREHGISETAEFHKNNVDYLVRSYLEKEPDRKEIYAVMEQEQQLLIRQKNGCSENVMLEMTLEDSELELECQKAAGRIQQKLILKETELQKEETERLLERARSKLEKKQNFSWMRAIKKKMETRKAFVDKRMEDYDFREIDVSDTIFYNCSLCRANFSHVNMENTLFINCDLTDAIFYKAHTAGAAVIQSESESMNKTGEWNEKE